MASPVAVLDLLDARPLVHAWTTAADVDATKPQPDLVVTAVEKAGVAREVADDRAKGDLIETISEGPSQQQVASPH
jgi:beta-phosphoglucomutase-like phosphatase (HAD superfamily)